MKRTFCVFHSLGMNEQAADTAKEAVQKAFAPLGFKDVLAVIDMEYVVHASQFAAFSAPFVGFAGQPATGGAPR